MCQVLVSWVLVQLVLTRRRRMNLARRLNAGKISTPRFCVASATAEYRGDSSVANRDAELSQPSFPGFEKPG
jgi:hypothetical protein